GLFQLLARPAGREYPARGRAAVLQPGRRARAAAGCQHHFAAGLRGAARLRGRPPRLGTHHKWRGAGRGPAAADAAFEWVIG
nr:hypothetical protein [Tanacetum cinerariifolium]